MEPEEPEPDRRGDEPEPEPTVHNDVSGRVGGNVYQGHELNFFDSGEYFRRKPERKWVEPRELPPGIDYFVDRESESVLATAIVDDPNNTGGSAILVSGITGVGSSAFVLDWGHRMRHRFPDGDLYADLDNHRVNGAASPETVLKQLLLSCGVQNAELAGDLPSLKAQFRRVTYGRRLLLVADNARNDGEVSQLRLPSPGSVLIATSSRMDKFAFDLDHVQLRPLPETAARELVSKLIGERADAEPDAVTELIGLCDRMPLAIGMALARMRRDEDLTVADVVAAHRPDTQRPGAKRKRAAMIDSIVAGNYGALPTEAAFLFRSLAWHPGPDFSRESVDAIGEHHDFDAQDALDTLLDLHLLERRARSRYRLLPLLREYARKRSRESDGADPERVELEVWADWYLNRAQAADHRITPDRNRLYAYRGDPAAVFPTAESARDWFAEEQHVLLALQRRCLDRSMLAAVLRLAEPMWMMYLGNRDIPAFLDSMRFSVEAAVALSDGVAEVRFRTLWARPLMDDGRYADASRELRLARERAGAEDVPDELLASSIEFTGRLLARQSEYRQAIEQHKQARLIFAAEAARPDVSDESRRANRRGVALQDQSIGRDLLKLGEARAAEKRLRQADTGMTGEGRERDLATIRTDLGEALRRLGEVDEADLVLSSAVRLLSGQKWYRIEADAVWQLLYLAEARGDTGRQRDCLNTLRNLLELSGDARIDKVLRRLSELEAN